jgi:hypothetical protein
VNELVNTRKRLKDIFIISCPEQGVTNTSFVASPHGHQASKKESLSNEFFLQLYGRPYWIAPCHSVRPITAPSPKKHEFPDVYKGFQNTLRKLTLKMATGVLAETFENLQRSTRRISDSRSHNLNSNFTTRTTFR